MSLEEFKKFTQIRPAMDFIGATPDYGPQITVLMGSRPNEPIHRGHIGAIGHVMAVSPPPGPPVLASAHAILAGLDAAGGMAFAPKFGKPGLAHLNGQNGCRYGQDKRFGVENLRGAVNPIQALCGHNYGANGEMVGLDIKAMDAEVCRSLTGQDNQNALALLNWCEENHKPVWIRHVLVPGITLKDELLSALARHIAHFQCVEKVELLPFHKLGEPKWANCAADYELYGTPEPTDEQVQRAKQIFRDAGIEIE